MILDIIIMVYFLWKQIKLRTSIIYNVIRKIKIIIALKINVYTYTQNNDKPNTQFY